VEVLYDHLLLWLNEDATRQPNDIMVMVPDISVFAPHIHAVLGQQHSALSYHVADTTAQEEPLVQALSQLLELPQLRVTHSQWRSWFDVAALRQRFGLTSADVQTIDQWLQDAGLRWGLDAAHRQSWGIDPALTHADQNSWLFALQRLLLGYASGDQQVWQDTAATCGIGSLDAPRMSALIRWLQRIVEFQQRLRQPHTPAQWVSELQALVEAFFSADEDDAQARLIERILKPLRQWLADCDMARFDDPLPLVVVRDNWLAQIQQPAMHQRFFGAGVQFATLMPMRSIPFKLVCLLGMNEADYPRRHTPVEFDLLQRTEHWRAGDRSRRDDDRYLFLEAVLSAREKLYLSWQSKRTHDHQDLPASVLVAQLMDYLHTAWTPARVATLYPLQAFSPQYFQKNASFFTYAKQWENVRTVPTTYAAPATEHLAVPAVVSIFQLTQLLRHPTQIYTQHRLNLKLTTPKAQVLDSEPFALNPLEMYRFTLEAVLAIQQHRSQPATPKEVTQALQTQMQLRQRQGQLSLAALGHYQQNQIMEQAHALCEQLAPWLNTPYSLVNLQVLQTTLGEHTIEGQWPTPQALWLEQDHQWRQIELRPGSVSAGKADASYPRGDTLCQLWAHHLLACASGQPTQSLQIGLDSTVVFDPISPTQAQSHLQHLLDQLAVALNRPLPISCKTACVYWQQMTHLKDDAKAILAAQLQFEGSHRLRGDLEQDVHLQRYVSRFEEIASDLAMWSEQLYAPMLTHARLVQTTGISGFSLSEDHV
jgi:exodeoxyribonuclease V gamma subunit